MTRFIKPSPLSDHAAAFGFEYPKKINSLIDGKPITGEDRRWNLVYPATEEVIAEVSAASTDQVNQAADIAHKTFKSGDWSKLTLETVSYTHLTLPTILLV